MISNSRYWLQKYELSLTTATSSTVSRRQQDAAKLPDFLYAAKYWDLHLNAAGGFDQVSPELQAKINSLFMNPDVYLNWVRAADSDDQHEDNEWSKVFVECEAPIHRASFMGLVRTVESLLAEGAEPLEPCMCSHPAWREAPELNSLGVAARFGNLDLLQLFLDKGLPLEYDNVREILIHLDQGKAGKARLTQVLQTLLDQGLLRDQPTDDNGTISEWLIADTLTNETSAVEIMNVFLDWSTVSTPITDSHLAFAICEVSSDSLARLLFERCDVQIPDEVFHRLDSFVDPVKTAGLAYLALERPNELPITETLVELFAREESPKVMEFILHNQKENVRVTQYVLEAAAANRRDGNMLRLLWPVRDADTEVYEQMLLNAAHNTPHQIDYLSLLLQEVEPDSLSTETIETIVFDAIEHAQDGVALLRMLLSLPSFSLPISHNMFEWICSCPGAVEMIKLLQEEKGIDVPVTESIIFTAMASGEQGPSLIKYLAQLSSEPVPVTWPILFAAVQNLKKGAEILQPLVPDAPDILFTDDLFAWASRKGNRDALAVLLDQKRREPPIEEILNSILGPEDDPSGHVLHLLLERNLVKVDEHVVEKLSENFRCLDILLSWKPDCPLNHSVLMRAAEDPRSMRKVMATPQGASLSIPDDVVTAAVVHCQVDVLQVILNRQGSLPIAKKILWEAADHLTKVDPNMLLSFLGRQPESLLTEFWQDIWRDDSFPPGARRFVLIPYLKKTRSNVTEEMLEVCSNSDRNEYDFGRFVTDFLCESNEISDPPATERAAEVIAEKCNSETVRIFLFHTQAPSYGQCDKGSGEKSTFRQGGGGVIFGGEEGLDLALQCVFIE